MSDRVGEHEVLGSEKVFDGRVVSVFIDQVRLPDGRVATWERVVHPGAVGMVPLTGDGTLLMVRQYRHAVRGELLEIPAGKLDVADETPEGCAHRELAEEVGVKAGELTKLAEFYNSPGYADEYFHLFLARDLSPQTGEAEPDEFLAVEEIDLEEALAMIATGVIRDAKSIIGISLTRLLARGEVGPFTGGGPA